MTSNKENILVVDDEADLVELVRYNLQKEGYAVKTASDGETALRVVKSGGIDLAILDLMLPGIQGMELCRMFRADPKTASIPIIMLTARTDEFDRVLGLEMGADDYVSKPFSPRELIARVRAVLRRSSRKPEARAGQKTIEIGDIKIDLETYSVSKKEKPIDLSATEFRLLLYLVERKGKVFSRDQLLDAVWGDDSYVEPRTVDVHVRRLRAQIEDDPANPVYIKTRRGIGYYVDGDI